MKTTTPTPAAQRPRRSSVSGGARVPFGRRQPWQGRPSSPSARPVPSLIVSGLVAGSFEQPRGLVGSEPSWWMVRCTRVPSPRVEPFMPTSSG
jgi:hypothetical protein